MERIAEQIQQLREEIEAHNYAYYVLSSPTISDYDFDQLLKKLEQLEQEYMHKIQMLIYLQIMVLKQKKREQVSM